MDEGEESHKAAAGPCRTERPLRRGSTNTPPDGISPAKTVRSADSGIFVISEMEERTEGRTEEYSTSLSLEPSSAPKSCTIDECTDETCRP
jgi:hypothetical protein